MVWNEITYSFPSTVQPLKFEKCTANGWKAYSIMHTVRQMRKEKGIDGFVSANKKSLHNIYFDSQLCFYQLAKLKQKL